MLLLLLLLLKLLLLLLLLLLVLLLMYYYDLQHQTAAHHLVVEKMKLGIRDIRHHWWVVQVSSFAGPILSTGFNWFDFLTTD